MNLLLLMLLYSIQLFTFTRSIQMASDDLKCLKSFVLDNNSFCLINYSQLTTFANAHELDVPIMLHDYIVNLSQSTGLDKIDGGYERTHSAVQTIISDHTLHRLKISKDSTSSTSSTNSTSPITYQLMQDLGSKCDKIFSHGYHRYYPSLFRQHNIHRYSKFNMLEIGYGNGNSVQLWQELFPFANIIWIDYTLDKPERINCVPHRTNCSTIGNRKSRFYHGDQSNVTFLNSVIHEQCGSTPCFDVIIDDGGHGYIQQLTSFTVLFPLALKPGGLYVIEDVETSYWTHGEQYGDLTHGGRTATHTPVGVWKKFVDVLNSKFHNKHFVADDRIGSNIEKLILTISFATNMIMATRKMSHDVIFDTVVDKRKYSFSHRVENYVHQQHNMHNDNNNTIERSIDFDYKRCQERMNKLYASVTAQLDKPMNDDAIEFQTLFIHEACSIDTNAVD